jgi:hypothetical protein
MIEKTHESLQYEECNEVLATHAETLENIKQRQEFMSEAIQMMGAAYTRAVERPQKVKREPGTEKKLLDEVHVEKKNGLGRMPGGKYNY